MQAFDLPTLVPPPSPPADPQGVALAVVEEAVAEAAAIREQARLDGLEEGRAAVAAEVASALAALGDAAAGLAEERERVAAEAEPALAELAIAVAEQVVAGALDVHPDLVVDAVRGALRLVLERRHVLVQVHPDDLALVRDAVPGVLDELGGVEHCDVQAERRMARGGAIVSTAEGAIDATVATKLARAREVVATELGRPRVGA